MSRRVEVVVPRALRLDRAVADLVESVSRRSAKRLIDGGAVFVDGKRCRVSARMVDKGARLLVHLETAEQMEPLPVLYEDDRVIAVDKPPGRVVNETETSAAESLVEQLGVLSVHRLDKGTSGVIIFAKDAEMAEHLSAAFRERKVGKEYLAVAVGEVESGTIDLPIGPDPKRPRARAVRPDGKPSQTEVERLSRVERVTAVAARLLTGRTHQIRVHLAAQGAPILGDLLYGAPAAVRMGEAVVRPERPLLHARRLNVEVQGRVLEIEAPLPPDFVALEGHGLAFVPQGP